MRPDLFREEALEFNRDKLLGEVTLVRPLSSWLLTGLFAGIALILLIFGYWGEYTRKAHVTGYLVSQGGLLKVYAPESGTLIEKSVKEGQTVKQGERLFLLSTERHSLETPDVHTKAIAKLQSRRSSLLGEQTQQTKIAAFEQNSLQNRLESVEADLAKLDAAINLQQQRISAAREVAKNFHELQQGRWISIQDSEEKQQALLEQEARLQAFQRDRVNQLHSHQDIQWQMQLAQEQANSRQAAIDRDIAALEQQLTEYEVQRNLVITAPVAGIVTTILAERGQIAQPNRPLLSIVPSGAELEAQLLVPSRAMGFIQSGQTVALRYQAYPYQRFGSYRGEVQTIARTPLQPHEADLPVALNEAAYRVTVKLNDQFIKAYGQTLPLQTGMVLDADIWLERRRLLEWLIDPLLSLTGKM